MAVLNVWIEGARPKTLIASISPVCIGSVIAASKGAFSPLIFALTLLFGISIQIGTNFANDYYDFTKGADTAQRKGPRRLCASAMVAPYKVLFATILMFSISALTSLCLFPVVGWPTFFLAASSIFFGIFYTAGSYSLAYTGLGEIFVLLFFGVIATCGSEYAQRGALSFESFLASFGPGLLSTGIIILNNLRDIEEDARAKKKTLAVRFGSIFAKYEYVYAISLACLVPVLIALISYSHFGALLASLTIIPAIPLVKSVLTEKKPELLNGDLAKTGALLVLYTFLFCIGWIVF